MTAAFTELRAMAVPVSRSCALLGRPRPPTTAMPAGRCTVHGWRRLDQIIAPVLKGYRVRGT